MFVADRLTVESLDARMAMVHQATSQAELERALAGLEPGLSPSSGYSTASLIVADELVPPRSAMLAALGGFEVKGGWVLPRRFKVIAMLGGASIDLREARFGAGVSEIDVTCAFGGVEVIVPPGVRVEVTGAGVVGGFDVGGRDRSTHDPTAPLIRVTGLAVLGGVDVQVKGPSRKMLQRFEDALRRLGIGTAR